MVILTRRLIIKTMFADEVCKENANLIVLGVALVVGRVFMVDDHTFHNERLSIRSIWLSPLPTYSRCGDAKPDKPGTRRVWRASNAAPVEPNGVVQG